MAKYTVYKTTNLINGKIYVGQHACSCKECFYYGSGLSFKRALKKYGISNFIKEIIFSFDSFEEMNEKEAEIVNEEFIAREDTYNLKTGGYNGILSEKSKNKMSLSLRNPSEETRMKISLAGKNRSAESRSKTAENNRNRSTEVRKKLSDAGKKWIRTEAHCKSISRGMIGRIHSEETKRKISTSNKGKIFSQESKDLMKKSQRERQRISWGNKDVLKIDPETNKVVGSYYYAADTGYPSSNILQGIKRNSIRYGYRWRLAD